MASQQPSSDLQCQMEEAGVSVAVQQKTYEKGFTCMRTFAGIEESRAEVGAMFKPHLGLDAVREPEHLRDVALLVGVWEACRSQLTYRDKNKQDARLGTQNRLVQTTQYAAMPAAVEEKPGCSKIVKCQQPSQAGGFEARAGRGGRASRRRHAGGHFL